MAEDRVKRRTALTRRHDDVRTDLEENINLTRREL